MGEHYDKLSEHERVALDWYVKGLLTGDIQEDFSRFRQHPGRIPIVHPDEYREAAREFLAFDSADVQDIHRRYREHLSSQHGIRPQASDRDR